MNDVLRLCRQYADKGLKPLVVQFSRPVADSLESEFHRLGIEIITFGGLRWNLAAHALKLLQIIRRRKIEIVHSISLRPDLVNATVHTMCRDFASVSTVLNIALHDTSALVGRIPGRAMAALWLTAFKSMNAIATHSQGIFDYLRGEGLDAGKMRVIPNGVDTEHFRPADNDAGSETRQRLGIGEKDFVFGFAGNFLPVKGLDILLKAFAQLNNMENPRLMLIGDGPDESSLKKLAEELGIAQNIIWVPRNGELRPLYAAMDVFCLPSRSEGLSNALLEACACGLPCIVTDIAGSREVVRNGVNGYIAAPDDIEELAGAMNGIIRKRNDLPRMGKAARETVCALFSARSMAESYMRLYEELLPYIR